MSERLMSKNNPWLMELVDIAVGVALLTVLSAFVFLFYFCQNLYLDTFTRPYQELYGISYKPISANVLEIRHGDQVYYGINKGRAFGLFLLLNGRELNLDGDISTKETGDIVYTNKGKTKIF